MDDIPSKIDLKIIGDLDKNLFAVGSKYDPWLTLGFLLEAMGAQINIAAQYRGMSVDSVIEHCQKYIAKAGRSYKTHVEYPDDPPQSS